MYTSHLCKALCVSWSIAKPCMPSILFLYDKCSLPDAQLMHGCCNAMGWLVCVTYGWEGRVLLDYLEIAAPWRWQVHWEWNHQPLLAGWQNYQRTLGKSSRNWQELQTIWVRSSCSIFWLTEWIWGGHTIAYNILPYLYIFKKDLA